MQYQKFLRKSTYRRYGIFIATIIFSYYSIQAYVNNKSIDASIQQVELDTETIKEEIAYMDNFYKNYLKSEYATFFLGHENGQIYPWERIVRFKHRVPEQRPIEEEVTQTVDEKNIHLASPEESRNYFIETKLGNLRKLGIIK